MNTQGIRTEYNGISFRSRAEARWAATFDALGWRWTYEPVDLNGYIPDFILHFKDPIVVEVKGGATTAEELRLCKDKIEKSGWTGEVLLLASGDLGPTVAWEGVALGLLSEGLFDDGSRWFGNAIMTYCPACGVSFCSEMESYHCRRCGFYDGNVENALRGEGEFRRAWATASNVTQWKGATRNLY